MGKNKFTEQVVANMKMRVQIDSAVQTVKAMVHAAGGRFTITKKDAEAARKFIIEQEDNHEEGSVTFVLREKNTDA